MQKRKKTCGTLPNAEMAPPRFYCAAPLHENYRHTTHIAPQRHFVRIRQMLFRSRKFCADNLNFGIFELHLLILTASPHIRPKTRSRFGGDGMNVLVFGSQIQLDSETISAVRQTEPDSNRPRAQTLIKPNRNQIR